MRQIIPGRGDDTITLWLHGGCQPKFAFDSKPCWRTVDRQRLGNRVVPRKADEFAVRVGPGVLDEMFFDLSQDSSVGWRGSVCSSIFSQSALLDRDPTMPITSAPARMTDVSSSAVLAEFPTLVFSGIQVTQSSSEVRHVHGLRGTF